MAGGGTEDGGAVIINGGDGADNDGFVDINSVATSRGVRLGATSPMTITNIRLYTLTNVDLDVADNSIAANVCERHALTVTGILSTDNVFLTETSSDLGTGFIVASWVPTANTLTLKACNITAGALDPGAVYDARAIAISGS